MDKKTNNLSTCQLRTRQQNKTNNLSTRQLKTCQLKKDTSGGYCGGVPPLPIPNREVKPTCADGTAMQCGRVGSRLLLSERSFEQSNGRFFRLYPLRASRKSFRKRFDVSRLLLSERSFEQSNGRFFCLCPLWAFRKSLRKRFGVLSLGESHFPSGLEYPRIAKVVSRKVWSIRALRKSFPERFGISAHCESHFPNGL